MLEDLYRCSHDNTKVNWHQFTTEVNHVFAEDELEKNPLKETRVFEIPKFVNPNAMLSQAEEV